jgi:hypothetical protein
MYSITENINYSQLSSVAILLQPKPVSHGIIQGKDWVLSPYVLSSCRLPLSPTCLLVTVNEVRSYFASTIHDTLSASTLVLTAAQLSVRTWTQCVFQNLHKTNWKIRSVSKLGWEGEISVTMFLKLQSVTISCPTTRHEGAWDGRRYSSYSFSTSAPDGGKWSASRPGRALVPGKRRSIPII